MSLSPAWRQVFPTEDATQVVDLIRRTWDDLIEQETPKFNLNSKEPHLTTYLCAVLKTRAGAAGLTGKFSPEEQSGDPNKITGDLEKRSRADIVYFSDKTGLDLTFEFKKINQKSKSHKAYCQDGILRFIEGKYSKDQPLAFIIGMVEAQHKPTCIVGIQKAIVDPAITLLHPITQPSNAFPQHAEFDSVHARVAPLPNIVLSHLFLIY